ncbi:MAG: V-type ATP synthase subunit I [Clostridia bacterium]|nr:V-type ATP synthase subunit I [Clostridia bacterium]
MAIVEMAKIKCIGLAYQKEAILNTLHKIGCVEIFATEERENTFLTANDKEKEEITEKYQSTKKTIDFISDALEKAKGKPYEIADTKPLTSNFFVSYEDFIAIPNKEIELSYAVYKSGEYADALLTKKTEKVKLNNLCAQLEPYKDLKEKFSDYKDTKTTKVVLGTIKSENLQQLKARLENYPLSELIVYSEKSVSVIAIVSEITESDKLFIELNELGFTKCIFTFEATAQEKIAELKNEIKSIETEEDEILKSVLDNTAYIKDLKILCDFYKFKLEKITASENFRCTDKTFILEGYLPSEDREKVENALKETTEAVFIEFSEPLDTDNPPTLTKNLKLVHQTEFITDMYSVPDYREKDPNNIVFFFFMLFMGVIMADIGYGLLMIVVGLMLARKIPVDNGAKKLWNVIAIGGVFAIIFGVLFNSLFGFAVLPFNILPSPVPSVGGRNGLMTILLGCLGLGVLQIAVGYLYKGINCFRKGKLLDGILDGIVWVIFFIGFIFAGFNFLIGYLMPDATLPYGIYNFFNKMTKPGLIMAGGAIGLEALLTGRYEKGFGKFSKGFGAVYGLISIFSDILSYARLFGLMLSGMIIAQTFNDLGLNLMGSPIGLVFGPLVILLGHVFNIAMGVLGAYIHDSRLQYIEFFSKFYTGEGEPFVPLGSKLDYIYLTK